MSLVGNLEDLGLGEILQIVSLSRKSGILTLYSQGCEGRVFFRQGEVIRAASPIYQEGLGDRLVRKGIVDHAALQQAITIQKEEGFKERLGTILVKHLQISAAAIEEIAREETENVIYSLFDWSDGTFDFDLRENVDTVDAIESDPLQFSLEQGLNPQFLAMEGTRIIDEKRHRAADAYDDAPLTEEFAPPDAGVDIAFAMMEATHLSHPPCATDQTDDRDPLVLVDDNAATRESLLLPLEESGYSVYPFAGGEDALIKLASLYQDGLRPVLLIDLLMPKMDGTGMCGGVELLALVRDNFPDIPVLVMADYHDNEAEWKVRRMNFPLIMKPSQDEIGEPAPLRACVDRLRVELARTKSGEGPAAWCDKINLGDELRLELGEASLPPSSPVVQSAGISLLRGMLEELNDPALGGGIILLVLRFAAEFMNRAVIFSVKQEEITGLGQFGIEDENGVADARIRNMRILWRDNPLFTQVIATQASVKVKPGESRWDRYLFGELGGDVPHEVFIGPIVSEGNVVALLYGDNLPEKKPIGDTDSLEIFLSQAGWAMEKALLQHRFKGKSLEGM